MQGDWNDPSNGGDNGGGGDPGGGTAGGPADPWSADERSQAESYFTNFFKGHADHFGANTPYVLNGALDSYQSLRRMGKSHQDALSGVMSQFGWDKYGSVAAPPPSNGGGGSGGAGGGLLDPFGESFQPPTNPFPGATGNGVPDLPQFHPPDYVKPPPFSYDAYKLPTLQEAQNEPGYQFASQQGEQALQQAAAAKHTLNSGGTLKDILSWGNKFAEQNYGNVANRSLQDYTTNYTNAAQTYGMNVASQYNQPYQFAYQAALDQFAPQMTGYATNAAANQRGNELNYSNLWNQYLQRYAQYRNQKLDNSSILQNYFGS